MLEMLSIADQKKVKGLLQLIEDSYYRMGTNSDEDYRIVQKKKCDGWLEEITKILESSTVE